MNDDTTGERAARRLVDAIADGDPSAMERFYEMYESVVYAFARARLNDPHAAADVVNEVMLAVWRGAARFKGGSKVRTWVLGIANNKVMDTLRSRGRHGQDELNDELRDEAPETEDMVASMHYGDILIRCLRRLSDQHRQVVHLAFFEDLSYAEIADIVDCPSGTVKTRMYHARLSLRRCLERFGLTGDQL